MRGHDLTGKKFGRLTVLHLAQPRYSKSGKKIRYWHCKCECGNEVDVLNTSLLRNSTQSCGCLHRDLFILSNTKHGACSNRKMTRLYTIWMNMRDRCNNESHHAYMNYGGRGITVCDEWNDDYLCFEKWANENGYSKDLTLDRIDVDGNYEPSNCRWATRKEQANNKRTNRVLTINGETKTLSEWSEISGISVSTIWARMNVYGWDEEHAVFTPLRNSVNG